MKQLKENYIVPEPLQENLEGGVRLAFSDAVVVQNITTMFASVRGEIGSTSADEARRSVQQISEVSYDGNGSKFLTLEMGESGITELLRLSGSIKTELIPSSENYLDKKTYSWEIVAFKETSIEMKFTYDHPEYISFGSPDTMKITYSNT